MEGQKEKDLGARRLAWEILWRTKRDGAFPDLLLSFHLESASHLKKEDKALVHELVMGTLRWELTLDRALAQVSSRPISRVPQKLLTALRMGAYQLLFLKRVPASAAVNETVELVKTIGFAHAAGFANAVLRAVASKKGELLEPPPSASVAEKISIETSHPLWIVEKWLEQWGEQETRRLCLANNDVPPLTLRTNTLKTTREGLIEHLKREGAESCPTNFSPEGVHISKTDTSLRHLESFRRGLFQVQDEASQIVTHWLCVSPGQKVLDACAAPGGKTGHLAQLMRNEGQILAVDINEERLNLLAQECKRLGVTCVRVLKADLLEPESLGEELFDRILLDAPCSGLGVLRRNPDAKYKKSPKDVDRMASMQKRLLASLIPRLAPGGILVYSVCTHTPEETSGVLEDVLKGDPGVEMLGSPEGLPGRAKELVDEKGFLRTFPHRHNMDGFTAFRLRRV